MRLWTAQPASILRELEAGREVRVDPAHGGSTPVYSYRWLVTQLPRVLSGYGGAFPFTTRLPARPWRWSRRLGYGFVRGTEAVSEVLRPADFVRVHRRDSR